MQTFNYYYTAMYACTMLFGAIGIYSYIILDIIITSKKEKQNQ